uniref:Ig-like domain-containing protein n=1 Tax=Equus caballus TaxID=9796 RepID=A0A3Q2I9S3_HORSE
MLLQLVLLALLCWRDEAKGQRRPRINYKDYQIQVQPSVVVQEGLCVYVPCTFSYGKDGWNDSTPAHGYWFHEGADTDQDVPVAIKSPGHKVQKETQGRFHLVGDPQDSNCSLDIRDRGSAKWNYKLNHLSVRVVDILISGTLESGRPRNLTCTVPWACEWGTPPIFLWRTAAFASLGPMTRLSLVLTLTPRPQDHGTSLSCQVTLPGAGVARKRTIQLNVYYPLQNLTITVFLGHSTAPITLKNASSLSVLEGQSLHLVCVVDSNPPARLSWACGSRTLSPSQPSNPGVLELPQVDSSHEGEFTCQAQHPRGSLHVSLSLSVQSECTGKACPLSGASLGAISGACATALLLLSFYAIAIMRSQQNVCGMNRGGNFGASLLDILCLILCLLFCTDSLLSPSTQGLWMESQAGSHPDHPTRDVAAPCSGEEEELHYASLSFHWMKPSGLWEQEATGSEYSEIKFHK